MTELTPQEEAEIRARLEAAPDGWYAFRARADIARLLDTLAVLRKENERLKRSWTKRTPNPYDDDDD